MLREELERAAPGCGAASDGADLRVEVFVSPGGYILGEESALLECMEGHRGEPRNKPPFPGVYGLWGKPTLMNSVETFADVPVILERGARVVAATRASATVDRASSSSRSPGTSSGRASTACRWARRRASCSSWPAAWRAARAAGAVQPGGASSNFLGPRRARRRRSTSTRSPRPARCSAPARWW